HVIARALEGEQPVIEDGEPAEQEVAADAARDLPHAEELRAELARLDLEIEVLALGVEIEEARLELRAARDFLPIAVGLVGLGRLGGRRLLLLRRGDSGSREGQSAQQEDGEERAGRAECHRRTFSMEMLRWNLEVGRTSG